MTSNTRRTLLLAQCAFVVVVTATAAGCAYRTPAAHVPESIPAIDPLALDLIEVSVARDGRDADPEVVAEVRLHAAEILARAAEARGAARGMPARVYVRVELEESEDNIYNDALNRDGLAVFGMVGVPFGQYIDREKLSVDVTVEAGGRTFKGRGSADKFGSLYAPARRRALAVALDNALADAAATGSTKTLTR